MEKLTKTTIQDIYKYKLGFYDEFIRNAMGQEFLKEFKASIDPVEFIKTKQCQVQIANVSMKYLPKAGIEFNSKKIICEIWGIFRDRHLIDAVEFFVEMDLGSYNCGVKTSDKLKRFAQQIYMPEGHSLN